MTTALVIIWIIGGIVFFWAIDKLIIRNIIMPMKQRKLERKLKQLKQ
jgi:hypothetical protein